MTGLTAMSRSRRRCRAKTLTSTKCCRQFSIRRSAVPRHFDFALETGEVEPFEAARGLLTTAVGLADNAENVPLWWISNLSRHLIDDLWQHSLHQNLPTEPPKGAEENIPTYGGCLYLHFTPARPQRWSYGHRSAKPPSAPQTSQTIWSSPCRPARAKHE